MTATVPPLLARPASPATPHPSGNLASLDVLQNVQMIDVSLCFRVKGKRSGEGLVLGPGT